jgi:hypothetical protein
MADVRYTAIGNINNISKKLFLNVGLPQDDNNRYDFQSYNLSLKLPKNETLNVVLTNFIFGDVELDKVDDYYYKLEINLETELDLTYNNSIPINYEYNDLLFLLVHDNSLNPNDIKNLQNNILEYYALANIKNTYISNAYQKGDPALGGRPRTLGMSIIKK